MTENDKIEDDHLSEHVAGYGLTLNESRKPWQPAFEVLSLIHICAGEVHLDAKEQHVSWHWTFRKGKKALDALHAKLVTEAMQNAWAGAQQYDPDAAPRGYEGPAL